jgi:hypothetical protein
MIEQLFSMVLGGGAKDQISQTIGTDAGTAENAIGAALPLLVGAAARQASTPGGAEGLMGLLDRNQDGNVVDDLAGFLGNPQSGAGVGGDALNLLFGGQRPQVENGLSQTTGLNTGQIGTLLMMLAPIVLGFLGKVKQEQGLDASGVAGLLGQQTQQMEQSGVPVMGALSGLLDQNKDGNPLDDVMRMAGGLFGKRG